MWSGDGCDGFFGGVDELDHAQPFTGNGDAGVDFAAFGEGVSEWLPEFAVEEDDGVIEESGDFEAPDFEEFVECAEAAGENDQTEGVLVEHEFSGWELAEFHRDVDVGVDALLARQNDVEALGERAQAAAFAVGGCGFVVGVVAAEAVAESGGNGCHDAGAGAGAWRDVGVGQQFTHLVGCVVEAVVGFDARAAKESDRRFELVEQGKSLVELLDELAAEVTCGIVGFAEFSQQAGGFVGGLWLW